MDEQTFNQQVQSLLTTVAGVNTTKILKSKNTITLLSSNWKLSNQVNNQIMRSWKHETQQYSKGYMEKTKGKRENGT